MVSRVGGEGHGEVAAAKNELQQIVAAVEGACEHVVLCELHDMHMRHDVGEVATTQLRVVYGLHQIGYKIVEERDLQEE